jgi:hypothetical protein
VAALLSSGAPQLAATAGGDACCPEERGEEEKGAPCPDCPPGLPCACYPIRGAVLAEVHDVAPAQSPGAAIAVTSAEPSLRASVTDIFHPPRA